MRQTWRHLLFAHVPMNPALLEQLVPPGLNLDLFPDETGEPKAWLGVVPFRTEDVRMLGLPLIPGLADFDEINVRTYVHRQGKDPSVLFLSLDGGPWPLRAAARAYYKVPYVRAFTRLRCEGDIDFQSDRGRSNGLGVSHIGYRPAEALGLLEPGSLGYFLFERYQILAPHRGRIYRAHIYHAPYRAYRAEVGQYESTMNQVHGLPATDFVHFLYSDDVRTQFFRPERIA